MTNRSCRALGPFLHGKDATQLIERDVVNRRYLLPVLAVSEGGKGFLRFHPGSLVWVLIDLEAP